MQAKKDLIAKAVHTIQERDGAVKSAGQVADEANQALDLDFEPWDVRKVLREELHMSYRKLEQLHPGTNSDLNKVIRKQWAIEYMRLLKARRTIINIDETWLNMTEFRRHAWGERGKRLSVPTLKAMRRISMTLAFDNEGKVHYALSDQHTNSATFGLFMSHLAATLDHDRPGWRKYSVILLDNASYHKSAQALEGLEELELPIMYSGAYSFSIAACELFFSRLKQGVLNPDGLKLGKR